MIQELTLQRLLNTISQGLDGQQRRKLASMAVSQISSKEHPQHNIMLRVTDKGV
jgi:hypothetical protein